MIPLRILLHASNSLIPSCSPLSAAALESSCLSVFDCALLAATMSSVVAKHGHSDLGEKSEGSGARSAE